MTDEKEPCTQCGGSGIVGRAVGPEGTTTAGVFLVQGGQRVVTMGGGVPQAASQTPTVITQISLCECIRRLLPQVSKPEPVRALADWDDANGVLPPQRWCTLCAMNGARNRATHVGRDAQGTEWWECSAHKHDGIERVSVMTIEQWWQHAKGPQQ